MYIVSWDQHEQRLSTAKDVDELLDKIHLDPGSRRPTLVTVTLEGSDDSLAIGLGRDRSVLNYVSGSKNPPYFTSMGDLTAEGSIMFHFANQWSEFPAKLSIPISSAREAMSHFMVTGRLAANVSWVED
jgi:hypothetical protein